MTDRLFAMSALLIGLFATIAATAMPAAALPVIAQSLHASATRSIWLVAIFQIGSAMPLLPAALLVDLRGIRPVFLVGLALFSTASFSSAFCTTLPWLTASRALQGVGSAGVMAVTGAVVRRYYPADRRAHGSR